MITRSVVVAAAVAVAGLIGTGPAAADAPNGSYTRTTGDGSRKPFEVIFAPCGAGCVTYTVAESPDSTSTYHLEGNRWVSELKEFGEDSFDPNTLVGTYTINPPPEISLPRESGTYTLTKNG